MSARRSRVCSTSLVPARTPLVRAAAGRIAVRRVERRVERRAAACHVVRRCAVSCPPKERRAYRAARLRRSCSRCEWESRRLPEARRRLERTDTDRSPCRSGPDVSPSGRVSRFADSRPSAGARSPHDSSSSGRAHGANELRDDPRIRDAPTRERALRSRRPDMPTEESARRWWRAPRRPGARQRIRAAGAAPRPCRRARVIDGSEARRRGHAARDSSRDAAPDNRFGAPTRGSARPSRRCSADGSPSLRIDETPDVPLGSPRQEKAKRVAATGECSLRGTSVQVDVRDWALQ